MTPNKANHPRQPINVFWLLWVKEPNQKLYNSWLEYLPNIKTLFLEFDISKWSLLGFTTNLCLVKEDKFLWLIEKFWIPPRCLTNTYWNVSNSNFVVLPDFKFFSDFFHLVSLHASYETSCSSINIFVGKRTHCKSSQFSG